MEGLQSFSDQGLLMLDITNRLTQVTYSFTTTANVAGAVQIPGVGANAKPFYMVLSIPVPPYTTMPPAFTLNESTGVLSWTASARTTDVIVGVY